MSWPTVPFGKAFADRTSRGAKVLSSDYLRDGAVAVVDQGQSLVAGYVDDLSLAHQEALPVIIFGDHTRALKYVDFPFCMGADGVKVLKPTAGFYPKFLYHYLLYCNIPSAGYSRHFKFLKELTVPLPPLVEQKRIAAALDEVDALRTKRRKALSLLDDLARSVFRDMFGDPERNQKHLPVVPLGDISEIGTGGTPDRRDLGFYGGDIPWVKTGEVHGDLIIDTDEKITERARAVTRCKLYPAGSIVIALYGQGKTRGQCAVLGIAATTNQACAVVPPNRPRFNTQFMFHQLSLSYERLRAMARGGNQANLNLKLVSSLAVLHPALEQQDQFAERIEAIEAEKAKHRAHLATLDELFSSVQSRAFAGTLFG